MAIRKRAVHEHMLTMTHALATELELDLENYDEMDYLYTYLGYDLSINVPIMVGVESTSELMEKLIEFDEFA